MMFSPVCTSMWLQRLLARLNDLLHLKQLWDFFSCVSEHVCPDIASLSELLITMSTLVWFLSTVFKHVCFEASRC